MNTFTVSFAIVAVLVYSATATPCTDICGGQCALANQACQFTGTLGELCGVQNNICTQSCGAACHCADSCAAKCGGEYATCKGDGTQVLNVATCGLNLSVCTAKCQAQCQFDTFAGIVTALVPAAP